MWPTWDHNIILPPIIQALKSIPPNGSVLDIGCGNGAMLAEIRQRGSWKLCGVESSESGVSLARSQGFDARLADATADLTALFEPHSFDLIISVQPGPPGKPLLCFPQEKPHSEHHFLFGFLKNEDAFLGNDSHFNPLRGLGN